MVWGSQPGHKRSTQKQEAVIAGVDGMHISPTGQLRQERMGSSDHAATGIMCNNAWHKLGWLNYLIMSEMQMLHITAQTN
jgi:hypothetical protein